MVKWGLGPQLGPVTQDAQDSMWALPWPSSAKAQELSREHSHGEEAVDLQQAPPAWPEPAPQLLMYSVGCPTLM